VGSHVFSDPVVASMAAVAFALDAAMLARRRDHDPELLAAARRGDLTDANTQKGTPERRAVDRVKYVKRKEARPGITARQALGHPARGDTTPQISLLVADPPRFLIIDALSRRDLTRAGRYEELVKRLENGRIRPADFRRRVVSWRPIAGHRFLSDPDAVLAVLEERRAQDKEVFYYDSGRSS